MALEYLKVVKQFDLVVDAYKSGQEMDLNELPTPEMISAAFKSQKTEDVTQKSAGELLVKILKAVMVWITMLRFCIACIRKYGVW